MSSPRRTTYLIAAACGLIVANLYYPQTLVGPIGHHLGMAPEHTGLIVTLTQLGYCSGLLLLAPLADLLENRRLAITLTLGCALALMLQGLAHSPAVFLLACYLVGLCSVTVQVLVPLTAHLASEERRGRDVGTVMSGLMTGIMLARPLASAVAEGFGWQSVFWLSALVTLATAGFLRLILPHRQPHVETNYPGLLASMARLYVTTPVLLQRGLYQGFMFGAFSVFWTAAPLYLGSPRIGLNQGQIALFALVGVSGAVAAPIAGALADRGKLVLVTVGSMLLVSLCLAITLLPCSGHTELGLLLGAAVGIDFGTTANLVVSQREIFSLNPAARSRLNGLFIATFFVGGAAGSALGAWAFAHGGWSLTAQCAGALPAAALLLFLVLEAGRRRRATSSK